MIMGENSKMKYFSPQLNDSIFSVINRLFRDSVFRENYFGRGGYYYDNAYFSFINYKSYKTGQHYLNFRENCEPDEIRMLKTKLDTLINITNTDTMKPFKLIELEKYIYNCNYNHLRIPPPPKILKFLPPKTK
jgi:hypothetical protein